MAGDSGGTGPILTILCCVLEHPVNIANAVMSNVRVIFIVIIVSNVAIVYAVNR